MFKNSTVVLLVLIAHLAAAQVKSSYLYNTSMPYGTLDIRTRISSSDYFYIQENKTFSFRESAPGVRTNTYLDMTSWDSSPYKQGNLRRKVGTADRFVMNYRLLPPLNYSTAAPEGYPLIVVMHGAIERGNCYYNNCYHANWDYEPNANVPAAPKTSTHKLLNNDHHISIGGFTHLDARNKAVGKLPGDPSLTSRSFPGFVLYAQMFNVWDEGNVQDVIRLVRLISDKYKIDRNKIYIHGLSIGGYAVYEAIKRAPWLFAAALPMSAVNDAKIFLHQQQGRVSHIPLWIFQGGQDTSPSPSYTNSLVSKFRTAGAIVRYSLYSTLGHTCWNKAYSEPDFFSWMQKQSKRNIHVAKGIAVIDASKGQYPRMNLAEGFFAYQWEKDGVIISGATTHYYIARSPGRYRARFSRVAAPTSTQWNKWSDPVQITSSATMAAAADSAVVAEEAEVLSVYPNPSSGGSLMIHLNTKDAGLHKITIFDVTGRIAMVSEVSGAELMEGFAVDVPATMAPGLYTILIQGQKVFREKLVIQ